MLLNFLFTFLSQKLRLEVPSVLIDGTLSLQQAAVSETNDFKSNLKFLWIHYLY